MSTPAPGRTPVAGRYRLGPLLGQGGMGRVWAAHDDLLGRDVAVKEVLLPPGLPDGEREALLTRTVREARAAARVRHPHVVAVHDVVEDGDRPWLVLQLLAPRTLADVVAEEGPLAPARAARVGLQLLAGLAAVHAAGVLHRDVKPGNVLFAPDGGAVLADFGIATLDGDPAVTSTGLVMGSPAYLAPERARGEAPTPPADLWSLGATLFAAVEGRAPFHRDGPLPTLGALLTEDVPAAPHAGPLAPALAALLTKDPAARPDGASARVLLEAALAAPPAVDVAVTAAATTTTATQPSAVLPNSTQRVPAARTRRRALLAVAAAVALALPVAALVERPAPAPAAGSDRGDAVVGTAPPKAAVPTPTRTPAVAGTSRTSGPVTRPPAVPATSRSTAAAGQGAGQAGGKARTGTTGDEPRAKGDGKADPKSKNDDKNDGKGDDGDDGKDEGKDGKDD